MQSHRPSHTFSKLAVTLLPLVISVCVLVPAAFGQGYSGRPFEKAPPNTPAPNAQWLDEASRPVNLSDFRGEVVLLNFWATWCAPCVIEMPDLDALQKKYRKAGLRVVAVSHNEEGPAAIRPFYRKHNLSRLDIYYGGKAAAAALGARTLPTTYLIDREGMLVGHVPGFAYWQTPAYEKHIRAALRKGFSLPESPFKGRVVKEFTE